MTAPGILAVVFALTRPVRLALAGALLLAATVFTLAACGNGPGGQGGVRTAQGSCDDFETQAQAQRAANTLDGDEDGRYCERLPCPCAGPGRTPHPGSTSSSGAGPTGTPRPSADGGDDQRATRSAGGGEAYPATVTHVVDGDTIDARLQRGGPTRRIRLLGIDTPEKTELRAGHAECGGQDATRFTEALARRWPDVVLRTDPSQDAEDRYGRLLAYVDVAGEPGRSYQDELLTQGWAKVYVLERRPIARFAAFRGAAQRAEDGGRGVWRSCGGEFRRPLPG